MTDVEQFWLRLQPHFANWRPWNELHPAQQMQVVQGINLILNVL